MLGGMSAAPARLVLPALLLLAGCNLDFGHRPAAVHGIPVDDSSAPVSAVWIGHSSVLLRLGDKKILADANFSNHQSLYPRLTEPSITREELPPVDVVLVSHLHVDHYDAETLESLGSGPAGVFPHGAKLYTPGLPEHVDYLATWSTMDEHGVEITAVPARHSGGRWFVDGFANSSYTGYIIDYAGHRAFFAGDTGYDAHAFKEIGQRFPGIDVAFIPIAPARGGNSTHASPEEALDIFRDVGARFMIPIHYEAFYSSVVPYGEPRKRLTAAAEARGLSDRVFALHTGERWVMPDDGRAPYVTDKLPQPTQHLQGLQAN